MPGEQHFPERNDPVLSATSPERGTSGFIARADAGVVGNSRLTSLLGVVLLALLAIQVVSALFFALLTYNVAFFNGPTYDIVRPVHFFVGFAIMPLLGLKLVSTGWRFSRYYLHSRAYRRAGPPQWMARLSAPLLIISGISLFASGVEMWSFQNQLNWPWTAIHNVAAFTFVAVLLLHVVIHIRQANREAAEDLSARPVIRDAGAAGVTAAVREPLGGRVTRRAVLVAAVVLGAVLGAGASGWPSAALAWLMPRRAGDSALDFPVMNYEGGGQQVDASRWRLRITGAVTKPLELSEDDILALPSTEHTYAMNCVTGWSATRTWRGVPVATLLAMAGVQPDWGHADIRSTSGYHWDHRRSDLTLAGTLLCTHINGVRLNDVHGYPLRLMIPGTVGESNIKWVDGIHVATGAPELYLGEHLDFSNPTVTGPLLPPDPAGRPA